MKISFLFVFAILSLVGCENPAKPSSKANDIAHTDNYLPPVFTDSNRLTKIKAAIPAAFFRMDFATN